MKRPDIDDFSELFNYDEALEEYADQLEEELADLKEHIFDDPDTFYVDGHGNLFSITDDELDMIIEDDENNPADDEDFECPDLDDVFTPEPIDEARDTRVAVMNYILDQINERFAELRELVDDEST